MIALLRKLIEKNKIKKIKNMFRSSGESLKIFGHLSFVHPENIVLGNNVNINEGAILNATESEIKIGDNVTISANAMVLAASYDVKQFLQGGSNSKKHKYSQVNIGNNVWICAGAIVLPNVTIADHVIVGGGSVVTTSVKKSWCIVAGNPAKIVKYLDLEI